MINQDQLRDIIGSTAYDRSGDKIGKVGQVYLDDETDQPKWITVNTGLFGTQESFVPLQGADLDRSSVRVAYEKAMVKDAPTIAEDGHLSQQEEAQLYRYYGLSSTGTGRGGRDPDHDSANRSGRGPTGYDTSGPTTDDAMTRSEEQLRVGTETHEAGRARLRKHVVTEHQQVTVPVSREEVTVEREPITDANRDAAYDGPAISDEEHEVVLTEERAVVDKEAVPVERVRLGTETVRDTETVGGEIRKEEIEVDDPTGTNRRR